MTFTNPMQPPPQTAIPAVTGDVGHPVAQRVGAPVRRGSKQAAEDDGRPVAPAGRPRQLLLDRSVGDTEEDQVDRALDVVERWHAAVGRAMVS